MCFLIFVDALDYSIKKGGCYFLLSSIVTEIWFGAGWPADIELQPVYEQESVYGHINLLPGKYLCYLFSYILLYIVVDSVFPSFRIFLYSIL